MFLTLSNPLKLTWLTVFALFLMSPAAVLAQSYDPDTGEIVITDDYDGDDLEATIDDDDEDVRPDLSRFTILKDGTVKVTGLIDFVSSQHFVLLNEGEKIRVNLENIPQSEDFTDFIEEGELVTVRGDLVDSASVRPEIMALAVTQPKSANPAGQPIIEIE